MSKHNTMFGKILVLTAGIVLSAAVSAEEAEKFYASASIAGVGWRF